LLEANGWAVNGRVKINIPFGTKLTQHATLPPGSHLARHDPYEDKAAKWRRRQIIALVVLVGLAALAWSLRHKGYYTRMREVIGLPTTPATNTVRPER
jgi:hypothetical protein